MISRVAKLFPVSKKIDQVILHIGTRKTGSTSIQQQLMQSREQLEEQGFFVARPRGKPFRIMYTSLREGNDIWLNTINEALERLKNAGGHSLIISSEDFYYLEKEHITQLIEYCREIARSVKVVLFLRRQDQYADSCYCQYATAGSWVGNIQNNYSNFLENLTHSLNIEQNIQLWESLSGPGDVAVIPYVRANTAKIFFETIGVGQLYQQDAARSNVRDPADMLRTAVFVGEQMAQQLGMELHSWSGLNRRIDFRAHVRHHVGREMHAAFPDAPKYAVLPEAAIEDLASRYEAMNNRVLRQYETAHSEGFNEFSISGARGYIDLGIEHIEGDSVPVILRALIKPIIELSLASRGTDGN